MHTYTPSHEKKTHGNTIGSLIENLIKDGLAFLLSYRDDKHNTEGQNKSKFKFLTTNSETRRSAKHSYLYKLPKEQARAIFMARTRMIKVKTNYKNMYTNTICRGVWPEGRNPTTCTRGMHFNPHTGQPNNTNQPTILQWPNNYQTNSQQTNNPIKNHIRMGTSVACYDRARRPGAPGNTHAKRKRKGRHYTNNNNFLKKMKNCLFTKRNSMYI